MCDFNISYSDPRMPCFWQPWKRGNGGKKKANNKGSSSRIIGYYGDWGMDENIDLSNIVEQEARPEKGKGSDANNTLKSMVKN